MLDSGINSASALNKQTSDALDALHSEALLHTQADRSKSYLDTGVSAITEFWHGSGNSGKQVSELSTQIQTALAKGDDAAAAQLAAKANQVVDADKKALQSESTIDHYGSNFLKTVGLFLPGRSGYVLSSLAYAAGGAKYSESLKDQAMDAGLGAVQGAALKGSFDLVGKAPMGIVPKAVSLGIASRLTDSTFSRQNYYDAKTHEYSAATGASNIWHETANPAAIATDVATFALAQDVLGRINAKTGGALNASPFWSTVATGGVFGVTTGGAQELVRQQQSGEKFDLGKVFTAAAINGATDMVAAAPGGAVGAIRANRASDVAPQVAEVQGKPTDKTNLGNIERNFPGATGREYQLVDKDLRVADLLRMSAVKYVYAPVHEIDASGKLGPQQNLLVQHLDNTMPLNTVLAKQADILATCNPDQLTDGLQSKHILPSTQKGLWLTQAAGGKLQFTMEPLSTDSVELGGRQSSPRSVTETLLDPDVVRQFRIKHETSPDIARAMRHFKTPVDHFIDAGADNMVMRLTDGNILKITDQPWRSEWGHRTLWTPDLGTVKLDAPIIGKPQTIDLPEGEATYYLQPEAQTPVRISDVRNLNDIIEEDGTYRFWDKSFTDTQKHGAFQLGYIRNANSGRRGVYLLDYDAVREPNRVPKGTSDENSNGESEWSPLHYLRDLRNGNLDTED